MVDYCFPLSIVTFFFNFIINALRNFFNYLFTAFSIDADKRASSSTSIALNGPKPVNENARGSVRFGHAPDQPLGQKIREKPVIKINEKSDKTQNKCQF